MSNIYINEPPTRGKVLLKTSVGDIDIELWAKETPKACRNFIQLCLEGYYDNTIFHRVVKGFIAQGGDPTGTGLGGESIYGEPFKDEFHSRLKFNRRGLVAMANAGKDDNGSQFFFTLAATNELQNKHTIFGKVTGTTMYNMIKLEETLVDRNERPMYPQKIYKTEILSNPFDDILPRALKDGKKSKQKTVRNEKNDKGKKAFNLLSFGDEAVIEEEEMSVINNEFKGKSKSSHDLIKNDPKLSAEPAIEIDNQISQNNQDENKKETDDEETEVEARQDEDRLEKIKKRFSRGNEKDTRKSKSEFENENLDDDLSDDGLSEKQKKEKNILNDVREEYQRLKKELILGKKKEKKSDTIEYKEHENPDVEQFRKESAKYKSAAKEWAAKKADREEQALRMLESFKNRLFAQKNSSSSSTPSTSTTNETESESNKKPGDSWLAHELRCQKEEIGPILAKDANLRDEEDWFDIYDPRNPINKRRREGAPAMPEEIIPKKNKAMK